MAAVSDAGPLIWLGKYDLLNILKKMYSEITVPKVIYDETVVIGLERGFNDAQVINKAFQEKWIKVYKPSAQFIHAVERTEKTLGLELGEGEREAIALALEKNIQTILTNDEDAYQISRILRLKPKGVLYILLRGVKERFISKTEARKLLKRMLEEGFWLSPSLVHHFHEALDKM